MKDEEKVHSMPNILYFGDVMRDILFNAKIVMKLDTKSLHFFT